MTVTLKGSGFSRKSNHEKLEIYDQAEPDNLSVKDHSYFSEMKEKHPIKLNKLNLTF